MSHISVDCLWGRSAHRPVLLGFAPADLLFRLSFADILDEATGHGYQRPINERHSLDFRQYIQEPNSSTIPLTLNLRTTPDEIWRLIDLGEGRARLEIAADAENIMAQVDCQHRLGHLSDLAISLPFMCFVELSEHEEMEVFSIINSKAKGLSASLLDFHESKLSDALAQERPELFIALQLNSADSSPWKGRLNLGGKTTPGLKRIVSLRMMQQAVSEFLKSAKILSRHTPEEVARILIDFWNAVTTVLPAEWDSPRRHLLTKGVGVYALMKIASDIYLEQRDASRPYDKRAFTAALADFATNIDWSTTGTLQGFGGQGGVKAAVESIRDARRRARYKVINAQ